MEAKESRKFWVKADKPVDMEESSFLLTDLPGDWRITVDSHSSSPIFADEAQQLIFAARKVGDVDVSRREAVEDRPQLQQRVVAAANPHRNIVRALIAAVLRRGRVRHQAAAAPDRPRIVALNAPELNQSITLPQTSGRKPLSDPEA